MNHIAVWSGIAAVVVTSTIGDVLQSRAMKEIGDLGLVRQEHGTCGRHSAASSPTPAS